MTTSFYHHPCANCRGFIAHGRYCPDCRRMGLKALTAGLVFGTAVVELLIVGLSWVLQ